MKQLMEYQQEQRKKGQQTREKDKLQKKEAKKKEIRGDEICKEGRRKGKEGKKERGGCA